MILLSVMRSGYSCVNLAKESELEHLAILVKKLGLNFGKSLRIRVILGKKF